VNGARFGNATPAYHRIAIFALAFGFPVIMQISGMPKTQDRINQAIPRDGKLSVFAVIGQYPAVSFERISATIPGVSDGDFNFSIFQPSWVGQALLEERGRRIRERIGAMRPRRILLRR